MTTSRTTSGNTVAIDALDLRYRMRPADAAQLKILTSVLDETPPVLALVDGEEYRLLDGFMRVDAARALGWSTVKVEWVHGDAAAAWERAIRTNVSHGLPFSLRQRRQAASRLLTLASHWSDRRIASACGVDAKTVGRLRKGAVDRSGEENPHLSGQDGTSSERVGRDGRRYLSAEELQRRREAARRLLSAQSTLSDRRAGDEVGLSAAAVRRVREQRQPQAPQPAQIEAQIEQRPVEIPGRWRSVAAALSTAVQTVRAVVRRLVELVRVRLRRR